MKKLFSFLLENLLQTVYFVAFEAALFFSLRYLFFDEPFTQDSKEPTIVPRWAAVVYFILAYVGVVIAALLVLRNVVPRSRKQQVMRWFWLALALMLPFLIVLINR